MHRSLDACLSSTGERIDPAAAPTSPYPRWCPYNPYTVGSLMGVQKGWASNVFESTGVRPFSLPLGTYVVESRVAKRFWPAFGLTAETASVTTRMTVTDDCHECRRPGRTGATDGEGTTGAAPGARPTSAREGRAVGPVPDLRSLPAFGIALNPEGHAMRFAATVWNAGDEPAGHRRLPPPRRRGDGRLPVLLRHRRQPDRLPAGRDDGVDHHANHNHWHFEDFARYDLLDADKQYVKKSRKQRSASPTPTRSTTPCPAPTGSPRTPTSPPPAATRASLSIREVLASGSGDTYASTRAGQSFKIGELPNGVYYIRVEGNPERNLTESDTTNNVADRRIRIGGTGDARWVKVAPLGDIVEPEYY